MPAISMEYQRALVDKERWNTQDQGKEFMNHGSILYNITHTHFHIFILSPQTLVGHHCMITYQKTVTIFRQKVYLACLQQKHL